jgi:hypothetical protein
MTLPKFDPQPESDRRSGWRRAGTWFLAYVALGAAISILATVAGLDGDDVRIGSLSFVIGPYIFLIAGVASQSYAFWLGVFAVVSFFLLIFFLPALVQRDGFNKGILLACAAAIWLLCGLVGAMLDETWGPM